MKNLYLNNYIDKEILEELEDNGYRYIVKYRDKSLSDWGKSSPNGHIQLIACHTHEQALRVKEHLKNDKTACYVDHYLNAYNACNQIKSATRGKTFTLRTIEQTPLYVGRGV